MLPAQHLLFDFTAGIVTDVGNREITIEGRCITAHARGLNADSTRTIEITLGIDANAVEYVFEETEVS